MGRTTTVDVAIEPADPSGARRPLVDGLARSAMTQVFAGNRLKGSKRHIEAADMLTAEVLRRTGYDPDAVLDALVSRGIERTDILDICIPRSAEALGQAWVDDELGFTQVSAATSRLYGLSKAIGQEWDRLVPEDDGLSLLVVSFRREDHLLGPGILAQQLRRRGHSVHVMSNTDADSVCDRLDETRFDCLMVSVASLVGLANANKEIGALRAMEGFDTPVVVGGRALAYMDASHDVLADVVTDDVDHALSQIGVWVGN